MYPRTALDSGRRALFDALERTLPRFVAFLAGHRPPALRGRSLAEVMPLRERHPRSLIALSRAWDDDHGAMRDAPPSLALAVIGQARHRGAIGAERESRTVANLLTYWALRSTLDITELCAASPALQPRRAAPIASPLAIPT
jgi:hypothetical protein